MFLEVSFVGSAWCLFIVMTGNRFLWMDNLEKGVVRLLLWSSQRPCIVFFDGLVILMQGIVLRHVLSMKSCIDMNIHCIFSHAADGPIDQRKVKAIRNPEKRYWNVPADDETNA